MQFNKRSFWIVFFIIASPLWAQNDTLTTADYTEEAPLAPLNDNSSDGQRYFAAELMRIAGIKVDYIEVYQTLPNHARVLRVKYNEENQGGFIFIRWDKKKKENYVANKMIDPGVYYNLNAAREIMREQTDKIYFKPVDAALQAPDQETISPEDLEGLRQQYELDQEEKKMKELERANKKKRKRKQ